MQLIKLSLVSLVLIHFTFHVNAQWNTSGSNIYNSNTGNVGIGTSTPSTKLHINGDITADAGIVKFGTSWPTGNLVSAGSIGFTTFYGLQIRAKTGTYFDFGFYAPNGDSYLSAYTGSNNLSFGGELVMQATKRLFLDGGSNTFLSETAADVIGITTGGVERMRVNESGQVGIGITSIPSGYKFAVAGNIITEKVRVKLQSAGWPDYVFSKDYVLPSLKEVEDFIQKNQHLPGVPSAEIIGKEGLDLGEGQAFLLKKIEELTLYVIDLNKRVEVLTKENAELKQKEGK